MHTAASASVWPLLLAIGCSSEIGQDDEVFGDSDDVPCDTVWVAESGDDYGEPWSAPNPPPDSPAEKLDMEVETGSDTGPIPDVLIGDQVDVLSGEPETSEDVEWSFAEGTYFRHATTLEVLENGLAEGELLVIAPEFFRDIDSGMANVAIRLPLHGSDGEIEVVDFQMAQVGDTPSVIRIETGANDDTPERWTRYPFYATRDAKTGTHTAEVDGVTARLVAAPGGHASLRGVAGEQRITMRGPLALDFDEVALPHEVSGYPVYGVSAVLNDAHAINMVLPTESSLVEPTYAAQCSDGLDNDGNGVGDQCDYECMMHDDYAGPPNTTPIHAFESTKSFGLFGDLLYCSANLGWDAELTALGMEAAQMLNWIDQGSIIDSNPPFRLVNIACATVESSVAAGCHGTGGVMAGDCSGDLAGYPLAGADADFVGKYLPNVWNLVDWYVAGKEAVPMHSAVVVATTDGIAGHAGVAFFRREPQELAHYQQQGASVINVYRYAGYVNIAHEVAHTMGLPHDTGEYSGPGNFSVPGLMNKTSGLAPFLGPIRDDEAADWWGTLLYIVPTTPAHVWQDLVPGKKWPRPSGFSYTGE